jgi:hypothetical protein
MARWCGQAAQGRAPQIPAHAPPEGDQRYTHSLSGTWCAFPKKSGPAHPIRRRPHCDRPAQRRRPEKVSAHRTSRVRPARFNRPSLLIRPMRVQFRDGSKLASVALVIATPQYGTATKVLEELQVSLIYNALLISEIANGMQDPMLMALVMGSSNGLPRRNGPPMDGSATRDTARRCQCSGCAFKWVIGPLRWRFCVGFLLGLAVRLASPRQVCTH